ncbi:hypothetical protein C2E23DRAFT_420265 [Lenzites betulinus]|nr:hypothetical protein C2E23DRAFT_420265 [Lenzites betulinus]
MLMQEHHRCLVSGDGRVAKRPRRASVSVRAPGEFTDAACARCTPISSAITYATGCSPRIGAACAPFTCTATATHAACASRRASRLHVNPPRQFSRSRTWPTYLAWASYGAALTPGRSRSRMVSLQRIVGGHNLTWMARRSPAFRFRTRDRCNCSHRGAADTRRGLQVFRLRRDRSADTFRYDAHHPDIRWLKSRRWLISERTSRVHINARIAERR